MNKTLSRVMALVLALLTVLSCLAFVGCGNDTPDEPDTPDTPSDPSTPTDPSTPEEPDPDAPTDYIMSIPKQNYGKSFVILTDTGDIRRKELYIANEDEAAGDTMDTAVFYRNNRVAEHLGVTIENMTVPGGWADRDSYINRIYTSYSTGDQDFQMASCYAAFAANGATSGYYYDLNAIEAIDLESPWYVQNWFENTLINDHCYMALGDLSLNMWKNLHSIYFNKQIADELELTSVLYQKALGGDWTFEFLMDCAQLSSSEDGNQMWDVNDTYGLFMTRAYARAFLTYFDIPVTQLNDIGEYEICLYNERTETIYGTLHSYLWDNDCVYKYTETDGNNDIPKAMFTEDRLLFFPANLQISQDLRSMNGDFGILPSPKLDDTQDAYHSHSSDNFATFLIPGHCDDPEFAGTVFDAMNAENKFSVIPVYYDVVLKGRTTKDEQSVMVLDIIRDHLSFDFSFAHLNAIDTMWTKFGNCLLQEQTTSFKTYYDGNIGKWEGLLADVMESYWKVR